MITAPTSAKTKAGIAYSQKEDSYEAGMEIAQQALKGVSLASETLFLLFSSPHHKVDKLIEGVRAIIGNQPQIFGCTTTGLIANDFISYNGALAGGGFISTEEHFFKLFLEESINDREYEAGKSIAKKIKSAVVAPDAPVLLFYDSIKVTCTEGQKELNVATPILEGFFDEYRFWPTVAGVGTFGDINIIHPCAVWVNDIVKRHALAAATFEGPIHMDTIIMHGTMPVGSYYTITKAEKNVILEIDNKPALDFIDAMLGGALPWDEFPLLVTLGVNNGDRFGPYKEEDYASRLCFDVDKERKALIMFETDLVEGTQVQLMRRNIDFNYIPQQVDKLMAKIDSRKPLLALYIDCLGRVSGFSGLPEEESLVVQKAVGDIPFIGIFSGVEIANVGPNVKALDWTGVLCLFSEA